MSNQWKQPPGDGPWMAGVEVISAANGRALLRCEEGPHIVGISCLRSLPPTITPEQRTVIEAAEAETKAEAMRSLPHVLEPLRNKRHNAVLDLWHSRRPPDPVAEVKAAFADYVVAAPSGDNKTLTDAYRRVMAAIAALEEKV